MKKILAVTVIGIALAPLHALAQERVGDAVLGALSGAIVLGPIGAAAGAAVGYVAGPAIARSWGMGRSDPRYRRRTAHAAHSRTRTATATSQTPLPPSRPDQRSPPGRNNSGGALGERLPPSLMLAARPASALHSVSQPGTLSAVSDANS